MSNALQSITAIKIRELQRQRRTYFSRKDQILQSANLQKDLRRRVVRLLNDIKNWSSSGLIKNETELRNISRWLEQSSFDPSVPKSRLLSHEHQLYMMLEVGGRKLDLADLYSRLLTEWLRAPSTHDSELQDPEHSSSDESFELVANTQKARLEQLRDKFAQVVFEPLETDEVEIDNYLRQLFSGHYGESALTRLREQVSDSGRGMLPPNLRISETDLKNCIKALLKIDLLNDEKRNSLNEILKDETVMSEICDVLNMRLRDLNDWNWELEENGMPVVP